MWCGNVFHWCRCISLRHHEPLQTKDPPPHYHPMSIRLSKAKALAHLSCWFESENRVNCVQIARQKTTVAERWEVVFCVYDRCTVTSIPNELSNKCIREDNGSVNERKNARLLIWILLLKAVHKPTFFEYFFPIDVTLEPFVQMRRGPPTLSLSPQTAHERMQNDASLDADCTSLLEIISTRTRTLRNQGWQRDGIEYIKAKNLSFHNITYTPSELHIYWRIKSVEESPKTLCEKLRPQLPKSCSDASM